MKTLADKLNDKIKVDSSISHLIQFEAKRYKSKGYGLIFAWIGALSYFLIFPKILKYLWPDNINNPGVFHFAITYALITLTLVFSNIEYLIYYYIEHPFFEKYKTNPDPWPWKENKEKWSKDVKKVIRLSCFNCFIMTFLFLIPNIITNECPHRYDRESFPGLFEMISQIAVCMLSEDFFFYLSHRLMHTDYLFKKIHKTHHEFVNIIAFSTFYSHPIEFIIGDILPASIGPLLMGERMHLLTHLVYIVMLLHENHESHSGYAFSWSPHRVIPFTSDSDYHIFHHWKYKDNYALYFPIWDRCLGTVSKYYLEYFKNKDQYIQKYLELNMSSNERKID